MKPQVENATSRLLSNQQGLRELGEGEDIMPVMQRVTDIGISLEDLDRIRSLEDAKTAAEARGTVPSADPNVIAGIQNNMSALSEQMGQYYEALRLHKAGMAGMWSDQAAKALNDLEKDYAQLERDLKNATQAGPDAGDNVYVIDAQLSKLKARVGNQSEAGLRTEMAQLQERVGRHNKRRQTKEAIKNIAAAGVPSLSAPIVPIDPFASVAA